MIQKNEIKIGTKFKDGKHLISEVVDIVDEISIFTGEKRGQKIYARGVGGLSTNIFETSFFRVQTHVIE